MLNQSLVNASPLIFLSKAGMIHLLQLEGPDVLVPEPVAGEIRLFRFKLTQPEKGQNHTN